MLEWLFLQLTLFTTERTWFSRLQGNFTWPVIPKLPGSGRGTLEISVLSIWVLPMVCLDFNGRSNTITQPTPACGYPKSWVLPVMSAWGGSNPACVLIDPHLKPCAVIKGLFMWLIQHVCGSNTKHRSHHLQKCWNTNEWAEEDVRDKCNLWGGTWAWISGIMMCLLCLGYRKSDNHRCRLGWIMLSRMEWLKQALTSPSSIIG